MHLYRIAPQLYLNNFSGLGASFEHGARWNRPRHPVIYMALSAGTALLEMANYLATPHRVPPSYRLGIFHLDPKASTETLDLSVLPSHWAKFPYPPETQAIGTAWLESGRSLALIVPSAAVPLGLEKIAVINPLHSDIRHLKLIDSTAELFNPRIFGGLQAKL